MAGSATKVDSAFVKTGSIKRKAPPPPILKKPSQNRNTNRMISNENSKSDVFRKTSLADLERKSCKRLSFNDTNLHFVPPPDSLSSEIDLFYSQPKKFSPEPPKGDVTISLTEVSSMKEDVKDLDDTLDFSISDDQILEQHTNSCSLKNHGNFLVNDADDDNNIDELFGVPPPPSPTDSIISAMDFIVPPPPLLDNDEDFPSHRHGFASESHNNRLVTSQYGSLSNMVTSCEQTNNEEDLFSSSDIPDWQKNLYSATQPNLSDLSHEMYASEPLQYHARKSSVKETEYSCISGTLKHFCPTLSSYDIDSGHGQSPELPDIDFQNMLEKTKNLGEADCDPTSSKTDYSDPILERRVSNSSWTSTDSASSLENDIKPAKVNLREMFGNRIKTLGSFSDEDEVEDDDSKKEWDIPVHADDTSEAELEVRLNDVEVCDWTITDVSEWLELIGLTHLKEIFRSHKVDGNKLTNMDSDLLDKMNIPSIEDKELILSEIYALHNPGDNELEVSMLDALDNAHGADREKLMALIQALQSPSSESYANRYITSPSSQTSHAESPRSVPNEIFHKKSDASIKSLNGSDVERTRETERNKSVVSISPSVDKLKKKNLRGFFASLRRKREKKSKSAIVRASMSMLMQASPQGMVKVLCRNPVVSKAVDINLLVSLNTTSREVCAMCLDSLSLHEDPKTFYISLSRIDGKIEDVDLTATECPLVFQCKSQNANVYQFELKQKVDCQVIVNKENIDKEELVTLKIGVSVNTSASDIIPVLVKRFKEREVVSNYQLQDSEGHAVSHDIPLLQLPLRGNKIHVFKFVNTASNMNKKQLIDYNVLTLKVLSLEKENKDLNKLLKELSSAKSTLCVQNKDLQSIVNQLENELESKNRELKKTKDEAKKKFHQLNHSCRNSPSNVFSELNETRDLLKNSEEQMVRLNETNRILEFQLSTSREKHMKMEDLNKEHKSNISALEEMVSKLETEVSQGKLEKPLTQNLDIMKLRKDIESMDQVNLEKDSSILERDFLLQKNERTIRELKEQLSEKSRQLIQHNSSIASRESLCTELEHTKRALQDNEKQNVTLKNQLNQQQKNLLKEKTLKESELREKEETIREWRLKYKELESSYNGKDDELEKLLVEKALTNKKYQFVNSKEVEDLLVITKDQERKISAKDIIIERLEDKIAKSDLTVVAKMDGVESYMKEKDEMIDHLEMKYARLENDHVTKLREFSNVIESKTMEIDRMKASVKTLEQARRNFENGLLDEKCLKDEEYKRQIKDLECRLKHHQEILSDKTHRLKELTRKHSLQTTVDSFPKKHERDQKQRQYLLEKLLDLVQAKAPSLLQDLGFNEKRPEASPTQVYKKALTMPSMDEWC